MILKDQIEALHQRLETLGKFAILNVDMIFNFPSQSPDMLRRDIDTLLSVNC
jgi:coproporphyrinogen III oxidase-like Fe-S oxidoreductase